MRSLPALSSLRAFEAAARHRSFKKAAEELGVTPTAISHRIRDLEEFLAVKLFERRIRHVLPTTAAEHLYPILRDGFDRFADAIAKLKADNSRQRVTISATPAFTSKWLVPRVTRFHELHPDIDLQFHASDHLADLASGDVDLALRYGHGPYPGLRSEPLLTDYFAPVMNPSVPVRDPHELSSATLLVFDWKRPDPANPTWPAWLHAAGLGSLSPAAQISFSDESHAIQAAVAGQGVALLSQILVRDDLLAGNLIRPFGPIIPGLTYHLVASNAPHRPAVETVRDWLLEESAAAARDYAGALSDLAG